MFDKLACNYTHDTCPCTYWAHEPITLHVINHLSIQLAWLADINSMSPLQHSIHHVSLASRHPVIPLQWLIPTSPSNTSLIVVGWLVGWCASVGIWQHQVNWVTFCCQVSFLHDWRKEMRLKHVRSTNCHVNTTKSDLQFGHFAGDAILFSIFQYSF